MHERYVTYATRSDNNFDATKPRQRTYRCGTEHRYTKFRNHTSLGYRYFKVEQANTQDQRGDITQRSESLTTMLYSGSSRMWFHLPMPKRCTASRSLYRNVCTWDPCECVVSNCRHHNGLCTVNA
jgi:hypothetical protein